jgi:hypothetical protein
MDYEYGALLHHIYEFVGCDAAGSGKSADPILHWEPHHMKNSSDVTGDVKN